MTLVDAEIVRCARTARESVQDEERSMLPTLVVPRQGVFRYDDGRQTAVADANTLLLFHPEQPYRISHPTDNGDVCLALRFDSDAVADALGFASEAAQIWIPGAATQRTVHRLATRLLGATDALTREELAFDLLLAGTSESARVAISRRDGVRIEAVRERLAANIGTNESLAALAREAGFSPFYLARRFRAWTGTSLHQYRLALRLNLALSMLFDGARDFTMLALDLGFASPAHFSAAFRNAYGTSPSRFAASLRR